MLKGRPVCDSISRAIALRSALAPVEQQEAHQGPERALGAVFPVDPQELRRRSPQHRPLQVDADDIDAESGKPAEPPGPLPEADLQDPAILQPLSGMPREDIAIFGDAPALAGKVGLLAEAPQLHGQQLDRIAHALAEADGLVRRVGPNQLRAPNEVPHPL